MSEKTGISWTDHTFNPWWGCHKVSDECTHCYAEATAERFHPGHWGLKAPRWFFGDKHWDEPLRWNKRAERDGVRSRVFCASMADVFEDHPVAETHQAQDVARARLWNLIQLTPHLDWLLLTKRPENFATMLPWEAVARHERAIGVPYDPLSPLGNVWLGVTAGVRASLPRIAILRKTPAAVRFVSCEPLLDEITANDWRKALDPNPTTICDFSAPVVWPIHWLIVGDESGKDRRAAQADWVRIARDAAARYGVAFHLKQWAGETQPGIEGQRTTGRDGKIHLPMLDGVQHASFPEIKR